MNALNKWRDLTTKSTRWIKNKTLNVLSALLLFWAALNAWRMLSVSLSRFLRFSPSSLHKWRWASLYMSSSILSLGRWQCRLNIAVIPLLPLNINAPSMLSRVDFALSLKSNSDNSALPKSTLTLHCWTFWHSDCNRKQLHIRKQHHSVCCTWTLV